MAENEVGILVNVVAKGQESLKQVDEGLGKLAQTTQKTGAATETAQKAQAKAVESSKQQIPILKELNPLLGAMGLGFLGVATPVAVALGALALLNKTSSDYFTGALNFGATTNNLTGSLFTLGETYAQTSEWAGQLGITQGDVEKAMSAFDGVTHDTGVSLSFLTKASQVYKATGIPLMDVVKGMSAAYTQFGVVVDKNTKGFLPAGIDAMNQYASNLLALRSSTGAQKAAMGTFLGTLGEIAGGSALAFLSPPPEGMPPTSAAEAGAGIFGPGVNFAEPGAGYFKSPGYGGNIPPMPINVNITVRGTDALSRALADSMQVDASLQGAP